MFVILYVSRKTKKYYNGFISTGLLNVVIMCTLSFVAIMHPEFIQNLDISLILWVSSGLVLILVLFIKIRIFYRLYLRMQDPEWYHFNYFGKKVLKEGIVKQSEFLTMFATLPLFLVIGAYFVAKLITLIRSGSF